ncbi:MAG TPA: hypothetical protein VGC23_04625 [Vicinamibacterales bacterium]
MSLILHLVRWDMRRFRIVLPLWLLIVAASAALEGAWPAMAVAMAAHQTVGIGGNLLALAEVLFSVVFIALVVQEHPLVGTTAFWMTRPIPPRALLASKALLLVAAVIVAPVFAEVVLMIVYGVPVSQIAAVAAQSLLFWALWLGIVMILAALTPNMAKLALVIGGGILAIVVSIVITVAILLDRMIDEPPLSGGGATNDPTSDVVRTIVVLAAAVILLVVQYRTRARARAVAIGVAGVAIAAIAGNAWSRPLLGPRVGTPAWAADPAMLQLSALADTVQVDKDVPTFNDRPTLWKVTRARVTLSDIAPGWSADISVREASIRADGGRTLTSRVRGYRGTVGTNDVEELPSRHVIRRLLGVDCIADGSQADRAGVTIVHYARDPELRQIAPATGVYDGLFEVMLTRYDVEAIVPLRNGVVHRNGACYLAIDRIRQSQGRASIVARESNAVSVFDRRPRSRMLFYLRNRSMAEAVEGSIDELRTDVTLARVIPFAFGVGAEENSGFRPRAISMQFPPTYNDQSLIALDAGWLSQAELVILRSTEAGSVERRLTIADFPIRTE